MVADYRTDKAGSIEGRAVARRRWFAFLGSLRKDLLDASGWMDGGVADFINTHASRVERREMSDRAREASELMGFWVAWHLAGGFEQLEAAGWHRATIFRKVKRFRDQYGVHPDEYEFPWLTIDCERAWSDALVHELKG